MRSRGRQQLTLVVGNYSIEIIYKFGVAKILTLRDFSASKSVWRERNYEIKQQKNTRRKRPLKLFCGSDWGGAATSYYYLSINESWLGSFKR